MALGSVLVVHKAPGGTPEREQLKVLPFSQMVFGLNE